MKGSKVFKNYLFNAGYQLLAIIVPLVTTPYISRVLNADGIGIYSFILPFATSSRNLSTSFAVSLDLP